VENWLVLLEKMGSCEMYIWVYTLCTFLPWRWKVLRVSNGAAFALVDHTFFSCLVQMPLCSLDCLRVVLLDVVFNQPQPAHIVALFDGFEPNRFD
jgi:hypothetical protein